MQETLKIFKIGGGIIDDNAELTQFLKDFSSIEGNKILVHGGGKGASKMLQKLGVEPKMINGRRITDKKTLKIVTGLYAGEINKNIVAELQKHKTNAVGLSGADGNSICGIKRPVEKIDFGWVGDLTPESVNVPFIKLLIEHNYTPVQCAITHDGNGNLLNTNADTVASSLAKALAKEYKVELHFCFDKIGVLKDVNDESSIIYEINKSNFLNLKEEGIIADGMIPKLENAFESIEAGVKKVVLEHPKNISNSIKTTIC